MRNSKRFSTVAPSVAESDASDSTLATNGDSRIRDIKALSNGFQRLNNSNRLQQQRYTPSEQKMDDLAKLALGAKVERALGRRMGNQDAVMRPRSIVATPKEKA